ncbi:MAG: pseudouridine synthase [Desulfomonilaceae bacterium]
MALKKIQMIIRDSGLASRRKAEEIIREGRVTLNGQVTLEPEQLADPESDHIKIDGKLIRVPESKPVIYLFNKPRFIVSTMNDPEGRSCLGDIIKKLQKPIFSVGRLDFDAEGLIVLTNNGTLAQKLSHPSNRIPRTYLVKVKGVPEDDSLKLIRKGMNLGEGERLGEVNWTVINRQKTTTWIKITLFEGKKNELKRIFFRINHPVRKLRRISFGPFNLGALPTGTWRPLTDAENIKAEELIKEKPKNVGPSRKTPSNRAQHDNTQAKSRNKKSLKLKGPRMTAK